MNTAIKAIILGAYLLAVVAAFGMLPAGVTMVIQRLALILLAAHCLELLFAFKSVKRYPGPLVDSIALTLLFGLLHWKPLSQRA